MFQDEFEKLSHGDKALFKESVNELLYRCYLPRRIYERKTRMFRMNPTYLFIERYFSLFEEYLSYMDMEVGKSEEDGVIYISSPAERNHLRFEPVTTLLVFALRSHYEGLLEKAPHEVEPLMNNAQLSSLLDEMQLSTLSKRISRESIGQSLRLLDSYNIISKASGSYSEPSYSFFILPAIRYVISNEKLTAICNMLAKEEESEEDSDLFEGKGE